MKTSIALINSSINLKQGNGINYNYYTWLKEARKDFYPNESLFNVWMIVSYANITERSCKSYFSTSL